MAEIFHYDRVNREQQDVLNELNGAFTVMERLIRTRVPAGRYQSLALTALEESSMWANKGISKDWPVTGSATAVSWTGDQIKVEFIQAVEVVRPPELTRGSSTSGFEDPARTRFEHD